MRSRTCPQVACAATMFVDEQATIFDHCMQGITACAVTEEAVAIRYRKTLRLDCQLSHFTQQEFTSCMPKLADGLYVAQGCVLTCRVLIGTSTEPDTNTGGSQGGSSRQTLQHLFANYNLSTNCKTHGGGWSGVPNTTITSC